MTSRSVQKLLEICIALSGERDRESLLSQILDAAMDIANSDGGTLYLLEDDGLHFCRMVTKSMGVRQGGHDGEITLPPVPLRPSHVCARAVIENRKIVVPDVHTDDRFDFSGARKYDEMTGYHTRSMLVVPLCNDKGRLIGVLQLINALDASGEPTDFDPACIELIEALSSQAASSITTMLYSEDIEQLLDSLVGALSTAIDQRTPYNANHTRNMARYAGRFLDWLDETDNDWKFDPTRRRAFLMSVWLHDVGKLVVPLSVMNKEDRLGAEISEVEHRFEVISLLDKIALLEGRSTQEEYASRREHFTAALELIRRVNKAGFLPDAELAEIEALAAETYADSSGELRPLLTPEELVSLSVRKGTLTAEERSVMENHVVMTAKILGQVTFPKEFSAVPGWAAAHHELLNGNGYPNHITAEAIPPEVRLLTVLDVFDALTARDRPYKPGMPVEKAFTILHSMVEEGNIDGNILSLFEKSNAWEEKTE
jgi:HD-GYP domain-containing protein (c-di-GMP phosphodiesterase class II)